MRWHKYLPIVTAVTVAVAATAAGASSHPAATKDHDVKGKIHKDTLVVTGTNGSDTLTLALRAGDSRQLVVGTGGRELSFDRNKFDTVVVNAGDGNDSVAIDESHGAFTDTEATTLNGEGGDDSLQGGSFAERLDGGDGNDLVDGNRGPDVGLLGAGDDAFKWDPGDGSDVVEGQDGNDTMVFNGANVAEKVELSANGHRLRFTRDVAGITMDTDGVENVDFDALGGADTVTVNDLSGTSVTSVDADLGHDDNQADLVAVNGTNAADNVQVANDAGQTRVSGLAATVEVSNEEPADAVRVSGGDGADTATVSASDDANQIQIAAAAPLVQIPGVGPGLVQTGTENLIVDGEGGDDSISGGTGLAALVALTIDGGAGNDTISGGDGAERLLGGDGNDFVDGNRGADIALLGAGDDTFQWDPGDGSDVVEGQDGNDTMVFNGANVAEKVELSANGPRLRFTRDVAGITMDTDGVENVDFNALGGADLVTVDDLHGTSVESVHADLGHADGAPDSVVVTGTNGADVIAAAGSAGSATVTGLAATVSIENAETPGDKLTINALAGDDVVNASGLAADAISLAANGGSGDDVLLGGAGADSLSGNDGDDVLIGGPGLDVLDGGAGSNTVIQ